MATANLNVCKYKPVTECNSIYEINRRFNLLFQEVCSLKNSSSASTRYWHYSITSADFESDGTTYLNADLLSNNTNVFWNDINRYIYRNLGEWQYVTGGIQILIPGFDANTTGYNLELSSK